MGLNFIDLFAGAGGLSEGFVSAGYNPVAHVEMLEDACMTLKTRECFHYLKSIGKEALYKNYLCHGITQDELYSLVPDAVTDKVLQRTMSLDTMFDLFSDINRLMKTSKVQKIDLIIGGPPCQAYSLVGRSRKGETIVNDPRNFLYKIYLEVLNEYKPKLFVFENVPGLLTANRGRYFEDIKQAFRDAGYVIDYRIVNARDFGVLQNRKRVILIGWREDVQEEYPVFEKIDSPHYVREILEDLPPLQAGEENNRYSTVLINDYLKTTGIRKEDDILTWHVSRPNSKRDREIYKLVISAWDNGKQRLKYNDLPEELCTHRNRSSFLDRFKVVAADLSASQTMTAHISKDGHYFIHPDISQARSISVREAARIQSFPDDYYFEGSRTTAYMQIGNAVPVLMAKGIAVSLRKALEVQK
ncbi:MAG: DNA cytosine methyltransferase [Solobacterium sp.]|nr:DNA cytosine methyltransferase [Solobacterium sp.]